jgi:transcription initiation factor TFIIIB Brf1 subunit/transcription initiation factor TFIIB
MQTAITDPESGEVIRSNCGLVFAEKNIDLAKPERRVFTTEGSNQRTRTGAPTLLSRHDRGLATIIASIFIFNLHLIEIFGGLFLNLTC